jgi:erythromycin esterase-like protein
MVPCLVCTPDDAARFRQQANECREQASKAVNPLDKEAWLRVAEEWLKLASTVDERRREGPLG